MNFNNPWSDPSSGNFARGRGRSRGRRRGGVRGVFQNNWMPRLQMYNPHNLNLWQNPARFPPSFVPIYNQPFAAPLFPQRSFRSPPPMRLPPPMPPVPARPMSPLPGSEEYTLRTIQQKSEFIKKQLNITGDGSDSNFESMEFSPRDSLVQEDVGEDVSKTNEEKNEEVVQTEKTLPKVQMKAQVYDVQEIYDKIISHISNLNYGKKMNLINVGSPGYDKAIRQIQRKERLELSRALRDMCSKKIENTAVFSEIIPDIGIKLEDLPSEVISQLSSTLDLDLGEQKEACSTPSEQCDVDPEMFFKQAENMLNMEFMDENDTDTTDLNDSLHGVGEDYPVYKITEDTPMRLPEPKMDFADDDFEPTVYDSNEPVISSDTFSKTNTFKKAEVAEKELSPIGDEESNITSLSANKIDERKPISTLLPVSYNLNVVKQRTLEETYKQFESEVKLSGKPIEKKDSRSSTSSNDDSSFLIESGRFKCSQTTESSDFDLLPQDFVKTSSFLNYPRLPPSNPHLLSNVIPKTTAKEKSLPKPKPKEVKGNKVKQKSPVLLQKKTSSKSYVKNWLNMSEFDKNTEIISLNLPPITKEPVRNFASEIAAVNRVNFSKIVHKDKKEEIAQPISLEGVLFPEQPKDNRPNLQQLLKNSPLSQAAFEDRQPRKDDLKKEVQRSKEEVKTKRRELHERNVYDHHSEDMHRRREKKSSSRERSVSSTDFHENLPKIEGNLNEAQTYGDFRRSREENSHSSADFREGLQKIDEETKSQEKEQNANEAQAYEDFRRSRVEKSRSRENSQSSIDFRENLRKLDERTITQERNVNEAQTYGDFRRSREEKSRSRENSQSSADFRESERHKGKEEKEKNVKEAQTYGDFRRSRDNPLKTNEETPKSKEEDRETQKNEDSQKGRHNTDHRSSRRSKEELSKHKEEKPDVLKHKSIFEDPTYENENKRKYGRLKNEERHGPKSKPEYHRHNSRDKEENQRSSDLNRSKTVSERRNEKKPHSDHRRSQEKSSEKDRRNMDKDKLKEVTRNVEEKKTDKSDEIKKKDDDRGRKLRPLSREKKVESAKKEEELVETDVKKSAGEVKEAKEAKKDDGRRRRRIRSESSENKIESAKKEKLSETHVKKIKTEDKEVKEVKQDNDGGGKRRPGSREKKIESAKEEEKLVETDAKKTTSEDSEVSDIKKDDDGGGRRTRSGSHEKKIKSTTDEEKLLETDGKKGTSEEKKVIEVEKDRAVSEYKTEDAKKEEKLAEINVSTCIREGKEVSEDKKDDTGAGRRTRSGSRDKKIESRKKEEKFADMNKSTSEDKKDDAGGGKIMIPQSHKNNPESMKKEEKFADTDAKKSTSEDKEISEDKKGDTGGGRRTRSGSREKNVESKKKEETFADTDAKKSISEDKEVGEDKKDDTGGGRRTRSGSREKKKEEKLTDADAKKNTGEDKEVREIKEENRGRGRKTISKPREKKIENVKKEEKITEINVKKGTREVKEVREDKNDNDGRENRPRSESREKKIESTKEETDVKKSTGEDNEVSEQNKGKERKTRSETGDKQEEKLVEENLKESASEEEIKESDKKEATNLETENEIERRQTRSKSREKTTMESTKNKTKTTDDKKLSSKTVEKNEIKEEIGKSKKASEETITNPVPVLEQTVEDVPKIVEVQSKENSEETIEEIGCDNGGNCGEDDNTARKTSETNTTENKEKIDDTNLESVATNEEKTREKSKSRRNRPCPASKKKKLEAREPEEVSKASNEEFNKVENASELDENDESKNAVGFSKKWETILKEDSPNKRWRSPGEKKFMSEVLPTTEGEKISVEEKSLSPRKLRSNSTKGKVENAAENPEELSGAASGTENKSVAIGEGADAGGKTKKKGRKRKVVVDEITVENGKVMDVSAVENVAVEGPVVESVEDLHPAEEKMDTNKKDESTTEQPVIETSSAIDETTPVDVRVARKRGRKTKQPLQEPPVVVVPTEADVSVTEDIANKKEELEIKLPKPRSVINKRGRKRVLKQQRNKLLEQLRATTAKEIIESENFAEVVQKQNQIDQDTNEPLKVVGHSKESQTESNCKSVNSQTDPFPCENCEKFREKLIKKKALIAEAMAIDEQILKLLESRKSLLAKINAEDDSEDVPLRVDVPNSEVKGPRSRKRKGAPDERTNDPQVAGPEYNAEAKKREAEEPKRKQLRKRSNKTRDIAKLEEPTIDANKNLLEAINDHENLLKIEAPRRGKSSKKLRNIKNFDDLITGFTKDLTKIQTNKTPVEETGEKQQKRPSENAPIVRHVEKKSRKGASDEKIFQKCTVNVVGYSLDDLQKMHKDIRMVTPTPSEDDRCSVFSESLVKQEPLNNEEDLIIVKQPLSVKSLQSHEDYTENLLIISDEDGGDGPTKVVDGALEEGGPEKEEINFAGVVGVVLVIKVIRSTILAATDSGSVLCYSLLTGELQHIFDITTVAITSMCILKNTSEDLIYIGSLDATMRVLNFNTKEIEKCVKIDERIQCMEHSWGYIFIGSDKGDLVRYDIKRNKVEFNERISEYNVLVLKATQEGARRVLLVATRNSPVCVRDAMSGLHMRNMEAPFFPTVYTLLFENSMVYCGTSQHDILVYTFHDGQLVFKHEATKSKGVVCMQIVGSLLFAGCYNGNIYVYNTKTNVCLGTMTGPGGLLLCMEIVNNMIIVGTKSSKFKAWRIPARFLEQS